MSTQLEDVRRIVRGLLTETESFDGLPPKQKTELAGNLVRVLDYLTDPNAGLAKPLVSALDEQSANDALKSRLAGPQKLVGADFKAGAATQGATVFKNLVKAVNFPNFVSGLIEGVYTSIVRSSIQQMQAYGKLLENVVKTVEEFANENITDDTARDFIATTFPKQVMVDRGSDGGSMLRLRDDGGEESAPDFKTILGMQENIALEEENEARIVLAAKLKMARQRQQHLAMMVMLGINRIVVTEGEIRASVLFDVKSKDTARRDTFAATSDTVSHEHRDSSFWGTEDTVDTRVSSAYSEEKEHSTADLDARAKLSGSVLVKFKSETFPLERLNPAQLAGVEEKSKQ